MELNYLSILLATIAQFVVGAVWYSLFFGKKWAQIHGFDKLSKETQQKMMKSMGLFYGLQFFITIITTFVLALFSAALPSEWNLFGMTGFFWLGFVVPTQVSSVIFGGTDSKWITQKITIMAGASLFCLEAGAAILHYYK